MSKELAKNKPNWLLYGVIALAAIVALAVGYAVLGGAAGPNPDEGVRVNKDGNTYTASFIEDGTVERWKYVIRDDVVCNGSHFSDGGRQIGDNIAIGGDGVYVIYGSDSFTPTEQQLVDYNYKFICFNALLTDGTWAQGARQLNWDSPIASNVTLPDNWDELTLEEKIALNPYNCPIDPDGLVRIDPETGGCMVRNFWEDTCLNEDSDWEGSANEDAWCTEDDDRTPIAPRTEDDDQTPVAGEQADDTKDTDEEPAGLRESIISDLEAAFNERLRRIGSVIDQGCTSRSDLIAMMDLDDSWILRNAIENWDSGVLSDTDLRIIWERDSELTDEFDNNFPGVSEYTETAFETPCSD